MSDRDLPFDQPPPSPQDSSPPRMPKAGVIGALQGMSEDPRITNEPIRQIFLAAVHYLIQSEVHKMAAAMGSIVSDDYETKPGGETVAPEAPDPPTTLLIRGRQEQVFTGQNTIGRACVVAEGFLKSGADETTIKVGDPFARPPKSPHHAAFQRWWEGRMEGQATELQRLVAMAKLMNCSFQGWVELAYYAGMEESK